MLLDPLTLSHVPQYTHPPLLSRTINSQSRRPDGCSCSSGCSYCITSRRKNGLEKLDTFSCSLYWNLVEPMKFEWSQNRVLSKKNQSVVYMQVKVCGRSSRSTVQLVRGNFFTLSTPILPMPIFLNHTHFPIFTWLSVSLKLADKPAPLYP